MYLYFPAFLYCALVIGPQGYLTYSVLRGTTHRERLCRGASTCHSRNKTLSKANNVASRTRSTRAQDTKRATEAQMVLRE